MIDMVPTAPDAKTAATHKLDALFDKALGFNVDTKIDKGVNVKFFKDGAS